MKFCINSIITFACTVRSSNRKTFDTLCCGVTCHMEKGNTRKRSITHSFGSGFLSHVLKSLFTSGEWKVGFFFPKRANEDSEC